MVKLVAIHGAISATEVVHYASEELDEKNAMHYERRHQAPRGYGAMGLGGSVLLLLLLLLETTKRPRVTRERVA